MNFPQLTKIYWSIDLLILVIFRTKSRTFWYGIEDLEIYKKKIKTNFRNDNKKMNEKWKRSGVI